MLSITKQSVNSNVLLWHYPRKPQNGKKSKCPSIDEWIKKVWYIYTMEYYSSIKQSEILSFATTWRELKIIM
jgi:hypothetical protein